MTKSGNVHFSSKTDEWATPQWVYDMLNKEFSFTLDPCATHDNAKCPKYFTRAENGLTKDWSGEVVFCNPPYGREIGKWIEKCYSSSRNGATCVLLIPARTDTAWFHNLCLKGEIRFFRGRLKFGNGKNSAPFPSMVVVFGNRGSGIGKTYKSKIDAD